MLKPKRESITVSKIVENIRSGAWAIPEALTDSEWKEQKAKAVEFISTLYHSRFVPFITLCELEEETTTFAQHLTQRYASLVLDGRKRIETLLKVTDKESDVKIVFNSRRNDTRTRQEGQFRIESTVTKRTKDWIDVNRVLGNREDFCAVLDEEESKEHRIRLLRLREILNHEIPVVKIVWHDSKVVKDIFNMWRMLKNAWK